MMRDGAIGALLSIAVGFGLLFVQLGLFPNVNLNRWMIDVIVSMVTKTDPENGALIGSAIGGLFNIPITSNTNSPFYMLQFFYASFLSFPSNIAWFLGGLLVGFKRVRSGRDEGNLKAGWDTFWYAMLSIEIPLFLFLGIFLITSIIPSAAPLLMGFSGSLLLYFLLFFLMPNFWLGLIFALLGSMAGSTMGRK